MGVITISRVPGSLGDTLARALAERLQYRLVERTELVQLAERIGGPDAAWERSPELRERSPSFWERLNEERRRYASVLRRETTDLAEEENAGILGLGPAPPPTPASARCGDPPRPTRGGGGGGAVGGGGGGGGAVGVS